MTKHMENYHNIIIVGNYINFKQSDPIKELIKIVSLVTQQSKELLLYEIENALSL